MKNLAIAGCKHTTLDLINGLRDLEFEISVVITITPEKAIQQRVSGYMDLSKYLEERGIPYYQASKYSLKSEEDEKAIKALNIDALICMGWQRLIPVWLLENLSLGAFGMHGSNKPLPHGRGRSPMNWSLVQNKKMFFTHLFQYKPGVDDGDIVGYQIFDITPFDTAHTLHFKNLLAMLKLCEKYLPSILSDDFETHPQRDIEPSYYPKRTAEDGVIFWEDSTEDIYNLIRAVTKPFPGAFTFSGDKKLIIWKAIPFDSHIRWDQYEPGTMCQILYDGSFIVKTGDTSLLVTDYEGIETSEIKKGEKLNSGGMKIKNYPNLPR